MKLFGLDLGSARHRSAIGVAIASALGLVIGSMLVPRAPSLDDPDAPLPVVELLGQPLVLDQGASERALDAVRKYVAGSFHVELPDGGQRRLSFGRLGVQIDKVRLSSLVRDARDR